MSPLPMMPPPGDNRETHERYIKEHAEGFVDQEIDYLERLVARLLEFNAFWWLGTCTALNASGKTATVTLDPMAGPGSPPLAHTQQVQWGRPTWTAAQLVGKRVRVGWSPLLGYGWIIDVVNNE